MIVDVTSASARRWLSGCGGGYPKLASAMRALDLRWIPMTEERKSRTGWRERRRQRKREKQQRRAEEIADQRQRHDWAPDPSDMRATSDLWKPRDPRRM
jgi:hypothetical protein